MGGVHGNGGGLVVEDRPDRGADRADLVRFVARKR
jgi:hypothetical protein